MANLLILKRRIKTAQNVSKTTRAMQMIAASKLKKAQDAALSARPYTETLSSLTSRVLIKIEDESENPYLKKNDSGAQLVILISPDKGLCGGLITNLTRQVLSMGLSKNTNFVTIGKKAENIASKLDFQILASFLFGTVLPSFDSVYPVIRIAQESFLEGSVSSVKIVSSEFVSLFSQKPNVLNLLPIEQGEKEEKDTSLLIFEPSPQDLLPGIIKRYFEMRLYQAFLESYLSEQAARMIAMQNATENALEIVEELKLEYNKQRQERITNEILDIGSASFIYE
ncbi:MAG: ATP synthase F1 subunit gamma [Patescibacteria group bacterium]